MSFEPITMDGQEAAQRMLSWGTYAKHLCLQAVFRAFPFSRSDNPAAYTHARVQWDRTPADRRHPGDRNPPAGAIVLWDLYVSALGYSAGHIAISVGGGRVVSTDWPQQGRIGVATIDEIDRKWNARYLGWTDVIGGHNVRVASDLGPKQRRVLPGDVANRRIGAASRTAPLGEPLPAGTVGNFQGWVRGENVNGNDVWFVGDPSGDRFWSGAFEGGANTVNLRELTELGSKQRKVLATDSANRRRAPYLDAATGDALAPGTVGNFIGWTRGDAVDGNDVWYIGDPSGDAFWSGGFEGGANTAGLPELPAPARPGTSTPANPSTPAGALDPAAPWKNRIPDSALATWVGSPNYDAFDRRPAGEKAKHITLHWMAGTLAGTDSHFQKPGTIKDGRGTGTSTTYGIGLGEIHQYVDEAAYHHGDGDRYSNAYGIAIEHEGGYQQDGKTVPVAGSTLELSARLCADVAKRHGLGELVVGVNVFPHNHWAKTGCPGTLDVAYIVRRANELNAPARPEPQPDAGDDEELVIKKSALWAWLKSIFGARA